MDGEPLQQLVLDIYQTVSEPEKWSSVLDRLTELVQAQGCIMYEWTRLGDDRVLNTTLITSNYDRTIINDYMRRHSNWEYRDHELFDTASLKQDGIDLVSETDLYEDEEAYLALPHVQEMLTYGVRHRYGGLLDKDNPFRSRFAIQTGEKRGRFSGEDFSLLAGVLPHVAKALDLGTTLRLGRPDQGAIRDLIDSMPVGLCLLDMRGHVVIKNTEFERQIDKHGAFWIDRGDKLVLHDQADRQHFDRLLTDAKNHGLFGARPRKEAVPVNARGRAGKLWIELIPPRTYAEWGLTDQRYALLISRDTLQPISIDMDMARLTYGYTEAEAEVTAMVCDGLTNAEIANRRERSRETINAQVKTILAKTGVGNRTQLVRLLCNFVAS